MESPQVFEHKRSENNLVDNLKQLLVQYKNYLKNIRNPESRKAFLLFTDKFKQDQRNNFALTQSKSIDINTFVGFIENVRRVENEAGLIETLENFRRHWEEGKIKMARGKSIGGFSQIESSILGGLKGRGVEFSVVDSLISLNSKLNKVRFVKAPLLDDYIGAADIYMAVQKDNENCGVFAIDISGAINKQVSVERLEPKSGNYPFYLYFYNQPNVYRIEFALNDVIIDWDDIEKIILSNIGNLGFYLDRYKRDPRYKNGISIGDFLEIIKTLVPPTSKEVSQIIDDVTKITYLFLLKNILIDYGYNDYADVLEKEIENIISIQNRGAI